MKKIRIDSDPKYVKRRKIAGLTAGTVIALTGLALEPSEAPASAPAKVCNFIATKDDARQGEGELLRDFNVRANEITITDAQGRDISTLRRDLHTDLGDAFIDSNGVFPDLHEGDKITVSGAQKIGQMACVDHGGTLTDQ